MREFKRTIKEANASLLNPLGDDYCCHFHPKIKLHAHRVADNKRDSEKIGLFTFGKENNSVHLTPIILPSSWVWRWNGNRELLLHRARGQLPMICLAKRSFSPKNTATPVERCYSGCVICFYQTVNYKQKTQKPAFYGGCLLECNLSAIQFTK